MTPSETLESGRGLLGCVEEMVGHTCLDGTPAVKRIMEQVQVYPRGNSQRHGMGKQEIASDREFYEVLHATFVCLQCIHSNTGPRQDGAELLGEGLYCIEGLVFGSRFPVKSIEHKRLELVASVCHEALSNVLPCLRGVCRHIYDDRYHALMKTVQGRLTGIRNRAIKDRDGKLSCCLPLPPTPPPFHARRAWPMENGNGAEWVGTHDGEEGEWGGERPCSP